MPQDVELGGLREHPNDPVAVYEITLRSTPPAGPYRSVSVDDATALNLDVPVGLYVSLAAWLALVALWRWPETAFKPTIWCRHYHSPC
jgi:hypothetical protein